LVNETFVLEFSLGIRTNLDQLIVSMLPIDFIYGKATTPGGGASRIAARKTSMA
jgi:hypothetical protein